MTATIPVTVIYKGEGFKQVRQDAASVDRELKRQSQERLRAIRLQARHERAVTQELKQQIRDQRRLNRLTEKLNRELDKQRRRRNEQLRTVGGAGLAAAGIGAAFAVDAVQAADAARVTETAFVNLSGGAEQAERNMEALRRATRDLVAEQQQQQIANQLLGMQLVGNEQELERLVGGARRLGKEFKGMGAADAAEEFALLLSNMSFQRLDQFGLSAGKVRERVNELKEAGMGTEEAFKAAVFEEMDKALERLGPEIETTSDKYERLQARTDDFSVAFGEMLQAFDDASGIVEALTGLMEDLTEGAESWTFVIEQARLLNQALEETGDQSEVLGDTWQGLIDTGRTVQAIFNPIGFLLDRGIDAAAQYAFNTEELAEAYQKAADEADKAKKSTRDYTQANEESTQATEENTDALEEQAKRLERVTEIRHDFARDLIRIDEDTQEEIDEAWDDYFEAEADAWRDSRDRISDIKKKAGKELAKIDRDLQKDLKKVNQDETKKIAELEERADKEQQQEARRRRVDSLADERLFNFEMRQLAAEGQANAIQEAMERRKIETQIAQEKAQVEQKIEDEKLSDEIDRVREAAHERRNQLRLDAEEEKDLRKERLEEEIAEEEASYEERLNQLREYREEKLVEIENSRQEAIQALGRELAEMKELTNTEMGELIDVAAERGKEVGKAFASGIEKGYETNRKVSEMLGEPTDFRRPSRAGTGRSPSPLGGPIDRFQHGGSFRVGGSGGPDSQLVQFLATPGEQVTVSPSGGMPPINIYANGPGVDQLVAILERKINDGFQEYTDTVLGPALGE